MDGVDDSELWMSEEEDGGEGDDEEYGANTEDPTFFQLELGRGGQSGGYHVRNKPGEKQRPTVSGFGSGSRKRPAFHVSCTAKGIFHGTLDQISNKRATLLVYDFSFFSYRSTRIKEANILFEFQSKKGSTGGGNPMVKKVAPYATHVMMLTTQTETRKIAVDGGITGGAGVSLDTKMSTEKSVEKTTTHAAEITGDSPFDDWGNYFLARWSLKENDSQKNGIVALLRTCILLTRDNDEEFCCIPSIEAKPNFKAQLGSLFSSRTPDDPILLDPEYDPYNVLEGGVKIDRWNLGAVNLDSLWDCTFHKTFGEAVKVSRTVVPSKEQGVGVEKVETVEEVKVAAS